MIIWQLFVGQNSQSFCFHHTLILLKNQAQPKNRRNGDFVLLRIVNNVRTIIQRQSGNVYIPDLGPEAMRA
jgi:hypothetical protein